jgi:hypothetical protein
MIMWLSCSPPTVDESLAAPAEHDAWRPEVEMLIKHRVTNRIPHQIRPTIKQVFYSPGAPDARREPIPLPGTTVNPTAALAAQFGMLYACRLIARQDQSLLTGLLLAALWSSVGFGGQFGDQNFVHPSMVFPPG